MTTNRGAGSRVDATPATARPSSEPTVGATPGHPGSPAPYHHGDLREALVAEAYSQVRAQGAEAVSLRAVAQAVGVSPSAAYHHFPDKTAILVEVAYRGAEELSRRSIQAAGALRVEDATTGLARLRAIGAAYIGFAVDEPHLFRHTFGPYCSIKEKAVPAAADGADGAAGAAGAAGAGGAGSPGADDTAKEAGAPDTAGLGEDSLDAHGLLVDTLDRLDALGALRRRDGLDLVAWAAVHGFASLVLDGFVPADAAPVLVDVLGSLVASPRD